MRKVLVIAAVAAMAVAAVAATAASGQVASKFSVIAVTRHAHGNIIGGQLFSVGEGRGDDSHSVGSFKAKITPKPGGKVRVRANTFFRGEGGGDDGGLIKFLGNIGRGDNRVNIIGGTGAFNGVGGKVKLHALSRTRELLRYTIVQ
jgi:hypothetical protein